MELHNLKPAEGSTHSDRRLGRGQGSGKGGTSTRGHKGQKSRSGQMPLQRRVPKFGFKNINRKEYKGINLGILQALAEKSGISEFTPEVMINAGLVSKNTLIKILGKGELKAQLVVKAHAFSETAKTAIEAAKGTAEKI